MIHEDFKALFHYTWTFEICGALYNRLSLRQRRQLGPFSNDNESITAYRIPIPLPDYFKSLISTSRTIVFCWIGPRVFQIWPVVVAGNHWHVLRSKQFTMNSCSTRLLYTHTHTAFENVYRVSRKSRQVFVKVGTFSAFSLLIKLYVYGV